MFNRQTQTVRLQLRSRWCVIGASLALGASGIYTLVAFWNKEQREKQQQRVNKRIANEFIAQKEELKRVYLLMDGLVDFVPFQKTELPTAYQEFYYERIMLLDMLHCVAHVLGGRRILHGDLETLEKRVFEFHKRFNSVMYEKVPSSNVYDTVNAEVGELRTNYDRFRRYYPSANQNPVVLHFQGMLHVLEMLIDDQAISVEYAQSYVRALDDQLNCLIENENSSFLL